MHPETWSIHIVISGRGKHFAEGREHTVTAGSVIYQGPRVRHSIRPESGHHLAHISIQYPAAGHTETDWVVCPDAGTTDAFEDRAAFLKRFGSLDKLMDKLRQSEILVRPRWSEFVRKRRGAGK
jgi:hypothetical protein